MAIIASAIFGRSAFTFGRIRIIRFISSEERCPLNMIYKHALETATGLVKAGHDKRRQSSNLDCVFVCA